MCGIFMSMSKSETGLEFIKTLEKRGPDSNQTLTFNEATFSFYRLAIMGLDKRGMQPFMHNNKVLVANGEIYNYLQIKQELKGYQFTSESDCEVLLPLFDVLGIDMFAYLDAEYALVLYDKERKSVIAARDPIGIRPLFYGYNKEDDEIMFGSEAKTIIHSVKKVYPFPPGYFYQDGVFTKYSTLYDIESYSNDLFHEITKKIHDKLISAIVKRLDSDAPMGFLLSGGLDSSIVCSIAARKSNHKIKTFSIGMESDPIDLKYAKQVSDYLGTVHTEVKMNKDDVIGSLDEVIYALETYDITTIRASIGMYILSKYIHENTDIKVLHTGEVSDELFGYKYTDFAPTEKAFQDESLKRVKELYMYDVLRADRCLASNSLEARVPFADIDFASYVLRISPIFKMNKYRMGKFLLRKSFEGDYLPDNILYRDKAAFSDAVGHSMVDYLKEHAESLYSDEEFILKKDNYAPTPFTKEALMYREIFEKHYPKHSHLIKNYWMPNKEWEGCNVDDPSARVLKNYGASGE